MTPRINHPPIPMNRISPDLTAITDKRPPLKQRGDFYWDIRGGKRVLVLAMPCHIETTDGSHVYEWEMSRWSIDHPNADDASWSWDGNEDKPTLSPSLHAVGIWHGYVRNGMVEEA